MAIFMQLFWSRSHGITLAPGQNFVYDIFKGIKLIVFHILITIPQKSVLKFSIDSKSTFLQVNVWHQAGDKPTLGYSWWPSSLLHIRVTGNHWVNILMKDPWYQPECFITSKLLIIETRYRRTGISIFTTTFCLALFDLDFIFENEITQHTKKIWLIGYVTI